MLMRKMVLFLTALMFSALAFAASSEPNVTFERRAWSPIEGAPTGAYSIAQSPDGLLWFASPGGVHRFDGERFSKVETIYGQALRSQNVTAVLPFKRGIAVTYHFGGISVFSPDGVKHYGPQDGLPNGSLHLLMQTADNALTVGTSIGLAVLKGEHWEILRDNGIPKGVVSKILVDRDASVWALADRTLYVRPKGSSTFSPVADLAYWTTPELVLGRVTALSPNGKMCQYEYGKPPVVLLNKTLSTSDMIFEGPLSTAWAWLGNAGGLVRLHRQESGSYVVAESFEGGRPNKSVPVSYLVDREGNTWISTFNGVERLRAQRIHEIRVDDTVVLPYVHQGLDDTILLAGLSSHHVQRIMDAGNPKQFDLENVSAMWRESADSVWAGSNVGLFHITHRGVTKFPVPHKVATWTAIQAITVDQQGAVWVSIPREGLYRFADGNWTHIDTAVMGNDAIPIIMLASRSAGVWLGFTNNRIGKLVDGVVHPLPMDQSSSIGNVLSLLEMNEHLIAGGENGIVWMRAGGNKRCAPELIKGFRGVAGLALDKEENLWVHGTDGIYRVTKDELDRFWGNPEHRVRWELFSVADGVRGNAAQVRPLPTLTAANDGRIFYATNSQVGWIDPQNLRRNARVPDVMILGLRAGSTELEPKGSVDLAAGTTALDIKYAVTALSVPEKVKIKYRLSGVDREWQEPTGERVARYTNLEPGSYTFQVIAANEDGVWNNEGATLHFRILPEFWQTIWFRLLVLAILSAIVIALYRWRVAMVAARSAERTAARIEERARIARSLHDNLLQGVHAMIVRSSTVLNRLPKGSQEERILEDVLDQAERLVVDTRDEVMALRDSQTSEQIVAELCKELAALEATLKGCLQVSTSAGVDRIRPGVARELCQVLKEGVINATHHSGASEIIARLTVTSDGIEGAVLDNGVGMAPTVAQNGSPGHWGIVGMRERIAKLGGTLTIERNGDAGTALRFVLGFAAAFH